MKPYKPRKYSHSSMAMWRRCRAKYYWAYCLDYTTPSSLGQIKGSAGHKALQIWYSKHDRKKALEAASKILTNYETETGVDMEKEWQLLSLVLKRYFDYSEKHESDFKTIATELKFVLPVEEYTITGYIDGVVEVQGHNWLLEHKFVKQASIKNIDIDPQISLYMYAARKLGYNPRGTFFNNIRMAKGGIAENEPVLRAKVYRNEEGLKFVEKEIILQMREMTEFHKKGGIVYRNPTKDCSWECQFYKVCLSINDNGDAQSVLDTYSKKVF